MDLEEYFKIKEEMRQRLKAEGISIVTRELEKFFDAVPQCIALRWRQYTPFFNDGDPCVFSVNGPEFEFQGDEAWVKEMMKDVDMEERERYREYPNFFFYTSDYSPLEKQYQKLVAYDSRQRQNWLDAGVPGEVFLACANVTKLLHGAEEVLQNTLGDHLRVCVFRDKDGSIKVETEEYDHE